MATTSPSQRMSRGPAVSLKDIIPIGVVLPWFGNIKDIPDGFQICNGTNGSPDLRDKFILGASEGEEPGMVGGNNTHTHDRPI